MTGNTSKFSTGGGEGTVHSKRDAAPGIGRDVDFAKQAAYEIGDHHQKARNHDPGTDGGVNVTAVELGQVVVIAPGHALQSHNQEREVEHVETHEDMHEGHDGGALVVHAAEHLGIPVVQRREEREAGAAEHDVVKVAHDEIGVVNVHVDGKRALKKTREPADAEKKDEAEREKHGRAQLDRAFVKRGDPIEDLDCARYGHQERQQREDDDGRLAHAAGKHVVRPYERSDGGDRHAGNDDLPCSRKSSGGRRSE